MIKESELAKAELDVKKEPEFVMEHLKNEELSLVEEIQDLKKEYLCDCFRNISSNSTIELNRY